MPPLSGASKGKGKNKEARRSRSRNTTPSSVISAGTAPVATGATTTPLLDLDLNKLLVSSKPNYAEATDYLDSHGAKVEPKLLHDIIEQLKHLSESAEKRIESCEKAIRLIHEQKKELESDQQDRERQAEHARRQKARKEESQKNPKAKKRKGRPETFDSVEIKREGMFLVHRHSQSISGRIADWLGEVLYRPIHCLTVVVGSRFQFSLTLFDR